MSCNIRIKLNIYFRKYLTHTIIFSKKKIFFKLERDISYFLDIFIFIVVIYIWKVRLFGNILILETITSTKK